MLYCGLCYTEVHYIKVPLYHKTKERACLITADGDFQGGFFFQSGATASYVNVN